MKRLLLTTLLLLPALFGTATSATAQCPAGENCGAAAATAGYGAAPLSYALQPGPKHPNFPPFGCCGYCIGFLSRLHFHGPLYNYGPYSGYYPFEPYGPWTADLRYNAPVGNCGGGHCGNGRAWGHYAVSTLKNVFHRVNPLANKCGSCLSLGNCGTSVCGTASACTPTCGGTPDAGCSTVAVAQPAQPAHVVATPVVVGPSAKSPTATGLLTGQVK